MTGIGLESADERPTLRGYRFTLILGLAMLSGCGSGADTEWLGTIEQRDGVAWVSNPSEPLWRDTGEPRLQLELEQVFGVDEEPVEAMLAAVRDMTVDDAGTVYVLDQVDNRLVAFDSFGEVLWSAGQAGEGPGDFSRPRGLAWDGRSRLYVLNHSGTLIDTWSTAGNYLDSRQLPEFDVTSSSTLGFLSADVLALVPFGPEPVVSLLSVGANWQVQGSFSADAGGGSLGSASVSGGARVMGAFVTTGSTMDYAFRVYGAQGQLVRVVTRPGTGFVPAAIDEERMALGAFGYVSPPLWLPDGYWLAQAAWPANVADPLTWLRQEMDGQKMPEREYRRVLDLFDAEGRWQTGLSWDFPDEPGFGTLEVLGPDGKLYTSVGDPYPHVRRYRIEIAR